MQFVSNMWWCHTLSALLALYKWNLPTRPTMDFPHDRLIPTWLHVQKLIQGNHDDATQWKHFPRYWPFARGIHRSPANSPHKGQWRGALMFSLICAWINGWVNNGEAGDLRRHRAHYDAIVMNNPDLHCWPLDLRFTTQRDSDAQDMSILCFVGYFSLVWNATCLTPMVWPRQVPEAGNPPVSLPSRCLTTRTSHCAHASRLRCWRLYWHRVDAGMSPHGGSQRRNCAGKWNVIGEGIRYGRCGQCHTYDCRYPDGSRLRGQGFHRGDLGSTARRRPGTWVRRNMMTSSNGNIFRVNGHLCGEFTGPWWIPHTKASDLRLNKRLSKQSWGWWFETLSRSLWRHHNELAKRQAYYLRPVLPTWINIKNMIK